MFTITDKRTLVPLKTAEDHMVGTEHIDVRAINDLPDNDKTYQLKVYAGHTTQIYKQLEKLNIEADDSTFSGQFAITNKLGLWITVPKDSFDKTEIGLTYHW